MTTIITSQSRCLLYEDGTAIIKNDSTRTPKGRIVRNAPLPRWCREAIDNGDWVVVDDFKFNESREKYFEHGIKKEKVTSYPTIRGKVVSPIKAQKIVANDWDKEITHNDSGDYGYRQRLKVVNYLYCNEVDDFAVETSSTTQLGDFVVVYTATEIAEQNKIAEEMNKTAPRNQHKITHFDIRVIEQMAGGNEHRFSAVCEVESTLEGSADKYDVDYSLASAPKVVVSRWGRQGHQQVTIKTTELCELVHHKDHHWSTNSRVNGESSDGFRAEYTDDSHYTMRIYKVYNSAQKELGSVSYTFRDRE